jgi:hypothetical protein
MTKRDREKEAALHEAAQVGAAIRGIWSASGELTEWSMAERYLPEREPLAETVSALADAMDRIAAEHGFANAEETDAHSDLAIAIRDARALVAAGRR